MTKKDKWDKTNIILIYLFTGINIKKSAITHLKLDLGGILLKLKNGAGGSVKQYFVLLFESSTPRYQTFHRRDIYGSKYRNLQPCALC